MSEVSSGSHKLKQEFSGDIQIEEWSQYSETERKLIRRHVIIVHTHGYNCMQATVRTFNHYVCVSVRRRYGKPAAPASSSPSVPSPAVSAVSTKVRPHHTTEYYA